MQTKRLLVLLDRVLNAAFFELNHAEIVVGHPATWIFSDGCTPEPFQIVIRRALSRRQHTQETQNREASGDHGPLQGLARPAQGHEAGRGESDRPQVSNRIRGINPPLRINKRELCRPKYLAEVKPNSPTRDQQSLDRSEGDKHPGALMIFFPPNGYQTDTEREDNERNNFQKRTAIDRLFFQPKNQQQRCRQRASSGFGAEREQIKNKRRSIENSAMLIFSIGICDPRQQSQ